MRKSLLTLATTVAVGVLASMSIANAQQKMPFDGKKFFDEIASKGFSAPASFDGQKFFDEIASKGYSDKKKIDGTKFFEEIASKGFKAPAGFDAKTFFEEQQKVGGQNYMPPMVDMTR